MFLVDYLHGQLISCSQAALSSSLVMVSASLSYVYNALGHMVEAIELICDMDLAFIP